MSSTRYSVKVRDLHVGDRIVTADGERHLVTSAARPLGGSGLVRFGFDAGNGPRIGERRAADTVTVERGEHKVIDHAAGVVQWIPASSVGREDGIAAYGKAADRRLVAVRLIDGTIEPR